MASIINFLLIAGVIQGFVFNLVTVFIKKKFSKVIIYLNLTVLFISLNNLQAWLKDQGYSSGYFFIKQLEIPWYVLVFPFFFLFLIHFLKVEEKVRDYLNITLGLFFIEVGVRIALILYMMYASDTLDPFLINEFTRYEEIINLVYCLYIFSRALHLVFKRQQLYAYILSYDDINWIKIFLRLGTLVFGLWVLAVIFYNTTGNSQAYYPLRLGTSILLYWIGYQGFYRYNVVHDRIMLRRSIASNPAIITERNRIKQGLKLPNEAKEKHQKEFELVNNHIIEEKRYLDPNISLDELAHELKMSVSHLSKLINTYSDYNFSDYINSLRVTQAKKLLADQDFEPYTVVSIGLESGFNSRSTFYSAFKKFTSQTPTEFKDSQRR